VQSGNTSEVQTTSATSQGLKRTAHGEW